MIEGSQGNHRGLEPRPLDLNLGVRTTYRFVRVWDFDLACLFLIGWLTIKDTPSAATKIAKEALQNPETNLSSTLVQFILQIDPFSFD